MWLCDVTHVTTPTVMPTAMLTTFREGNTDILEARIEVVLVWILLPSSFWNEMLKYIEIKLLGLRMKLSFLKAQCHRNIFSRQFFIY